ncbi:MAG: Cof-type HAD-IIB family hydrolase [Saccharofermentans sp.]|nr:Cof-type HAD-IIB family hydrolase [Saccharofermentans sp.]
MSNKQYKFLVATDMDYTLLMPGTPVSAANREAVKAIQDAGGAFTLATGRTSFLTGIYSDDLNVTVPLITSNGASLFDPITRKDIFSADFPEEINRKLITLFLENNTDATGYSDEGILFAPNSSRREFVKNYNVGIPDRIKALTGEITNDTLKGKLPNINKYLIIKANDVILAELAKISELQVVMSAVDFYDVMLNGTSKGLALRELANKLNIPEGKVYALGDSDNDIPMLDAADHAVVMGGSKENILSHADYVTLDCQHDGFAKAVFDFILPSALG